MSVNRLASDVPTAAPRPARDLKVGHSIHFRPCLLTHCGGSGEDSKGYHKVIGQGRPAGLGLSRCIYRVKGD